MIFYFLWLFRGTTDPPVLDPKHPLRHSFTRYGQYAARHPIITLLASVAVATSLVFPFGYLYTNNFTNGASNLPHHVWTSAQPYMGDETTAEVDVIMRTVWVHGSYMHALESDVLLRALEIQDELLGPTINFNPRRPTNQFDLYDTSMDLSLDMRDSLHAVNGLSNSSWFFHSPLQYWSCSPDAIAKDGDIITTVNEGSHQSTSVNVTLRHSIVFSGKRFEDHRLVAADALVITLVHKPDSPVGRQWEKRAQEIASRNSNQWRILPSDGRAVENTLYEFRFQPLSTMEDIICGVGYSIAAIFFFSNLAKMRALKSRLGLCAAAFSQFLGSAMSSLTICAIFKVDLSKIPREFYPVILLACGMENMFQLIDAVIMTNPQSPTAIRIGEALGQGGHVALANVAQRLFLLWVPLYCSARPEVTAFCTFAILALIIDFFYLLTFFLAVLSIDVQRKELVLVDSLTATENQRYSSPDRQPRVRWADAVFRGGAPTSTRIAGSLVILFSLLMVNSRFATRMDTFRFFSGFFTHPFRTVPEPFSNSATLLSVDIHQARTPTAWLRMQDHETAHEVIKVIKPAAVSYIARVYEPIVFVLDGSDRTPTEFGVRPFLPAAYDFIRHQSKTWLYTIVLILAAVALLLNYLLWDETPEDEIVERPIDEPLLSVKTLQHHSLDIMRLKASRDGIIVSVGLDRLIRVWNLKANTSYTVDDRSLRINPFPVLALAIDNDSNWLAILSSRDRVYLWNIPEKRWGPTMWVDVRGRIPEAFFFGYAHPDAMVKHTEPLPPSEALKPVVVVRHNGLMTELDMAHDKAIDFSICRSPLVCVKPHPETVLHEGTLPPLRVITSSKRGCVHIASQTETSWISEDIKITPPEDDPTILTIVPLPQLSSFLAVRDHSVDLIDIWTREVTHTFKTQPMVADTIRCFHSTRRRPQCGSVGLGFLAIAYTCSVTGDLILQSYLPEREGDTICFRDPYKPGSKTCCLWRETVEMRYEVQNPGAWEALQFGYVVGIRNTNIKPKSDPATPVVANSGLRRRGGGGGLEKKVPVKVQKQRDDEWEVWSLSATGNRTTIPLNSRDGGNSGQLLASTLGPIEKVGLGSIAVGLGNTVKVIKISHEKWDKSQGEPDDVAFVGMVSSRGPRKKIGGVRKKGV